MKRLVALLTAVLFIISACVFAGCGNGDAKTPIEKEKVDLSTLSNAELLALSFADSFAQDNALTVLADRYSAFKDNSRNIELKINKLVSDGEIILEDPIKLGYEGKIDYEGDAINGVAAEVEFELFGETIPFDYVADQNGIYATDLFGLNDEVIGITIEDINEKYGEGYFENLLGIGSYSNYESTYWEDATAIGIIGGAESNDFDYGYANSFPTDFDAIIDSALESVIGENYKDIVGDDFDVLYDLDYEALINGDIQGFLNGIMSDPTVMAEVTALMETLLAPVANSINNAIAENVREELIKKEIKDVTVEGVEFKNAYVISVSIDGKLVKDIIKSIYDSLLNDNGIYSAALANAGINIDEILAVTEGFSFTLNNVLSAEGESVSMDIRLSAMGMTVAYVSTDVETKKDTKFGILDANGNFDANLGYIGYSYEWNKSNDTEKGVLSVTTSGITEEFIKFEGSYDGNKREGKFYGFGEGTTFSFDYMIKGDDLCGEISVGNFAITENGKTEAFDVKLSFAYNIFVEGAEVEFGIKSNGEGNELDMEISVCEIYEDVKINVPKKYTNFKEMNQFEILGWIGDFEEKYPNIYNALMGDFGGSMGGLGGGYNDDYSFDMNDFSFDMDDYSFDMDDFSFDMDDYSFDFDF